MNRYLQKLKKELKIMREKEYPYIPLEEMKDICKYLSQEAAEDIMKNGYKDSNLIYKNLKTETLAELIGPEALALVVGTRKGTRVFVGESEIME